MQDEVFHIAPDTPAATILEKLEEKSRDAKRPYIGDWAENLQQIAGHLRDQIEAAVKVLAGALYDQKGAPGFGGTPFNVVMPFVNRYISKVTHLMKEYQVLPADDDEDEDQALADERILNGRWQTSKMCDASENAIIYACATSRSFVFTDADGTLDPQTVRIPVEDPETREPLLGHDGQPLVEKRTLPQGDTVHWALSALQVDLYPNQHGVQGSPIVAAHLFMSEEDIRRRYGADIPGDAKKATVGNAKVDALLGNSGFLWKVSHLWLKPTADRPRGEHYVIMGSKVIHETKKNGKRCIGTWNDKYPLVEFSDGLQAGYWGRGRHTAAKPIVKDICVAWSTISQIAALPGLIMGVPEEAVLSEKLANLRLLVFEKPMGGDSIDFTSAPRMPLHEYIIEKGVKQIGEIYSQHAVSRGESPGSRFPAKGLQMLWQVDVMAETPTGRRYLRAFRELGELELGEGRRVWPESVIAKVLGENGRWQRQAFYRGEIGRNVDVQVVPNREEPSDKDSLRKWLVEAGKNKLVDGSVVRRELGKPSKEDLSDASTLEENNAKDEEALLAQGKPVKPQWYDDHAFHFRFHLRAGAKRGMRVEDPQELVARREHVLQHLLNCPQPRLPEIMPLVPRDMLVEIKQLVVPLAAPPEDEGVPGEVPPDEEMGPVEPELVEGVLE